MVNLTATERGTAVTNYLSASGVEVVQAGLHVGSIASTMSRLAGVHEEAENSHRLMVV